MYRDRWDIIITHGAFSLPILPLVSVENYIYTALFGIHHSDIDKTVWIIIFVLIETID